MAQDDTSRLVVDLRVAIGKLSRRMRAQTAGYDLTRSQTAVLSLLDSDGPATSTELARAQGIRPQSMGAIVAALEALGLVVGRPDPGDGRKTLLRISDKATEMYTTGRLAKEDWLGQAIARTLTADEIEQLAESLDLLRRIGQA